MSALLERIEAALAESPVAASFKVEGVRRLAVAMRALREENANLRKDRGADWTLRDQKLLDAVVHYRNLAIALGAKPEWMLDRWDRDLCESGLALDQVEDLVPYWDEAQHFQEEAARLWTLLDEARAALAKGGT